MPIYEYHCQKCKKDHEIIQKFSDKPLKVCPACGGKMTKKMSVSGFHLKGGGWYKDGYSSPKTDAASGKDASPAPAGDKPAASSDKKEKTAPAKTD